MPHDRFLHNPPHWNYYLKLERDLEDTFQYVEPVQKHYSVFSPEFGRIILVAATEIENALCGIAAALGAPKPDNIIGHFKVISAAYPRFKTLELSVPRYSMRVQPWKDWSTSKAPDWWTNGYNKVKHDRLSFPEAPTLYRAVEAVAALQAVLLYLYRAKYSHSAMAGDRGAALILPVEPVDPLQWGAGTWTYELPDDKPYMPPPSWGENSTEPTRRR